MRIPYGKEKLQNATLPILQFIHKMVFKRNVLQTYSTYAFCLQSNFKEHSQLLHSTEKSMFTFFGVTLYIV